MRTRIAHEHKIRKIDTKGAFGLYECTICKDRYLAADRKEAEEIFSRTYCES